MVGTISDEMCLPNAQPRRIERLCSLAISEYQKVLELDAKHKDALRNLAYLSYELYGSDEAERLYRRYLALHGDEPAVLGAVAAIDYGRTVRRVMTAKSRFATNELWMQTHYCFEIRSENLARLEEGIALATRAMQISKDNETLMGYLSALFSLRADLQCHDKPAYEGDKKTAKTWDRERKRVVKEGGATYLDKCPPPPPPMLEN